MGSVRERPGVFSSRCGKKLEHVCGRWGRNQLCLYSALPPTLCPKFYTTHKPVQTKVVVPGKTDRSPNPMAPAFLPPTCPPPHASPTIDFAGASSVLTCPWEGHWGHHLPLAQSGQGDLEPPPSRVPFSHSSILLLTSLRPRTHRGLALREGTFLGVQNLGSVHVVKPGWGKSNGSY